MTRIRFALICLAATAVTTALALHSAAQAPAPPTAGVPLRVQANDPNAAAGVRFAPVHVDSRTEFVEVPMSRGELHKSHEKAASALKSYSDAETDEQRTAAEAIDRVRREQPEDDARRDRRRVDRRAVARARVQPVDREEGQGDPRQHRAEGRDRRAGHEPAEVAAQSRVAQGSRRSQSVRL